MAGNTEDASGSSGNAAGNAGSNASSSAGADANDASWVGETPRDWVSDDSLGPPDLSQSPQLACTSWRALRPRDAASHARFVSACFETGLRTWSAEIEPLALDRIASMTLSTALRVRRDATLSPTSTAHASNGANVATQSLAGHGARGKTSFGFTRDREGATAARGCMRLCVGDDRGNDDRNDGTGECAASVDGARTAEVYGEPPGTTLWLRATLAAVHHPRATLLGAVGLACALGCAAIATRRRPFRRTK